MKFLCNALLILFSVSAISQQAINKDVGDFSELKVFDLIEVELIKSDKNQVSITGENTEDVKVINDNGKLKIRMELNERFDGNNTFVKINYTSVDILDANEGAVINSSEQISQDNISLRAQEGGKINVDVDVNSVDVKSVSGGIISAAGNAKNSEVVVNSGGNFEGEDLKTESTKVRVTAGGFADVNASNMVDAKVTAGGSVIVYGNPTEVKKKKFAGGKIKIIE